MPRPYELLIFDWDGTLLDSIGSIVACTTVALAEAGHPPLPEAAIRGTIGLGLDETFDALLPEAGPELRHRIREAYFVHWRGTYHNQAYLFPWVEATLERLKDDGYLLAIATGKSRQGLRRDFARTDVEGRFVASRTVDEARSKPHPQMVLDLLDELGVEPRRALVIGDTTHDLNMARNARTPGVGVTSGSSSRSELLACEPLACLESVSDLPGWLQGAP